MLAGRPVSTRRSSPTTRSRTTRASSARHAAVLRRVDGDRASPRRSAARAVPHRRAVRPRAEPGRDVPPALRGGAGRRGQRRRARGRALRQGPCHSTRGEFGPGDTDRPRWCARRPASLEESRNRRSRGVGDGLRQPRLVTFPREPGRSRSSSSSGRPGLIDALRNRPGSRSCSCARRAGRARPARAPAAARRQRRGGGPARSLRPVRGRPRAPHRRLRALPGHRRQRALLGRARRGRRVRGAGRLARRHGRRPGASVRAAPRGPAVAAGAGRRRPQRPPVFRTWLVALGRRLQGDRAAGESTSTRVEGAGSAAMAEN